LNQIHEKDWAEESWGGHTGMSNFSDYSIVEDSTTEISAGKAENSQEEDTVSGDGK